MNEFIGRIVMILAAITLMAGVYMYISPEEGEVVYYVPPEKAPIEAEASAIIKERVENILGMYFDPTQVFNVTNTNEETITVNNYDKVVKSLFSANGINELEKVIFDDKSFVTKDGNKVEILKAIPEDRTYNESKITMKNYRLLPTQISATVTLTNSYMEENGIPNAIHTLIFVKLIKEDGIWLIDTFNYNEL